MTFSLRTEILILSLVNEPMKDKRGVDWTTLGSFAYIDLAKRKASWKEEEGCNARYRDGTS
jgi:hypothetical protein